MENSRKFIRSLERGLSILSILSESSSPLSLTELSQQLVLSISTLQRLTYTLQQSEYLNRDEKTKKFSFGPKVLSIGFSVIRDFDLARLANPYLEKLSRSIGESVNLSILEKNEIVIVVRFQTQKILNSNVQAGFRLPAYCTASGKAILAYLPNEQLEKILDKSNFVSLTSHTIKNSEALRRELMQVRDRGFATNNLELDNGLRAVAAPVRNFKGEVMASVDIAVPSVRVSLNKLKTVLSKKVIETADKISFALGYLKDSHL